MIFFFYSTYAILLITSCLSCQHGILLVFDWDAGSALTRYCAPNHFVWCLFCIHPLCVGGAWVLWMCTFFFVWCVGVALGIGIDIHVYLHGW